MRTRRDFVRTIAAAAALRAARALQTGPQIETLERRGPAQRVIVIGAGLAGLCTAYELGVQGHEVTLLEAQSRPGGRVRTLREGLAPGLYCEAGPETIPGAHEITLHYVRTFGLELGNVRISNMRTVSHLKGRIMTPATEKDLPFDLTAEERTLGYTGLVKKYLEAASEEAVAAGYDRDPIPALLPFDKQTPGQWLQSRGASRAAAELLSSGFGADFGSMASFLHHGLNRRGPGSAGSFKIVGGNEQLPQEFARRVPIRYGTPVLAVTQSATGVRITIRSGGAPQTLMADRAVCTLPCTVLGKIFDDTRLSAAKRRAIGEQFYSRTVKVFLQSRTRFWLKNGYSGFVTTDLPIERLTPDPGESVDDRGALAAYAMAGYSTDLEQMSEEQRIATALAQTSQIFPEMAAQYEGGISKCWGLDPWQRGSFALHTPGQIGFITVLAEREGRIHFAGEHTSAWTGWMQGALESARRVVKEVNG
ncbi:MAG TPA: NAD(P)/FAD-dependent oxidoreductase [Candidatus Solibacter sp.]|nr:NAD(P)/FAD-dependent oxidoreductase [Candidatus Solibacter sp.]